jgi:signal transduction histidine kinase
MTLQRRVMAALSGSIALFVVVLGALAFASIEEQEDALVDDIVAGEASRLADLMQRGELARIDANGLLLAGPDLDVWLLAPDGRALPEPVPRHLQGLADGVHRLAEPRANLHVAIVPTAAGRLFVQYDAERNEARVREFGLYLVGLSVLCIALGTALAALVARVVVRPIERVTARLDAWAPDARSTAASAADEETRLLDAFARVQSRLEQAMAHEREFAANLSHEIRTPLAALRTDLELLQLDPAAPGGIDRARRALSAADAIAGAVAAARAIQRQAPATPQRTALAQCVDDAWTTLGTLPQERQLRLVNEVPRDAMAMVDRHALLTILRNLLRNAAEHAAPATCTVRGGPGTIEVVDDGPGIPAADLASIFDRYWSARLADSRARKAPYGAQEEGSDDSRGLGLAIAKQVADLNGWRITAASVAGSGTRFTLQLAD